MMIERLLPRRLRLHAILATGMLLAVPCALESQRPSAPAVLLGAAWYPEQWNESQWESDLALMEQAHFSVVRVGEFAWSRMEPTEGHFDLDWLYRGVRLAEKHHIAVVIGTPTDAPPAWLTNKYPDTLGTDANGHPREHGGRRQFSYSSPHYRQFCIAIATQLARHFGHDANVIGWQIGNEYTDESFDAPTRKQFQEFLRGKYKTFDSLNQHWTTAYWSQTYTDWSQIPLPTGAGNPGLLLEHKHFVTATWRSFQRDQIAAIRPLADARQFITTNIGGLGWSDNWDHYAITADLDLASWDEYVGQGHLDATKEAFMNDFVRGWKRKNFWVMETQPGSVNWAGINNSLDPGETRALAWQAIGHGADAILYWQWRNALNGQEQYHGAIVGPDGQPNPIYKEIQQLGEDLIKTSAALKDTKPVADVAMLVDYDSRWAIDFQPHSKNYDQLQILLDYYKVLSAGGRTVDVVSADSPLDAYKLVVAPSLNVISKTLADHLLDYVKQGGQLVLGPRSGMKDEYDALDPHRQPGPLADALGAYVEQFYALDAPVGIVESQAHATIWAEQLVPTSPEATPRLHYGRANGWLDGKIAVVSRNIGKGTLTYVGALLEHEALHSLLNPFLMNAEQPIQFFEDVPVDVEVCGRAGPNEEHVLIVINHSLTNPAHLKVRGQVPNLLDSNPFPKSVMDLPPQGILVFTTQIHMDSQR